jgi:hypothetical protein
MLSMFGRRDSPGKALTVVEPFIQVNARGVCVAPRAGTPFVRFDLQTRFIKSVRFQM